MKSACWILPSIVVLLLILFAAVPSALAQVSVYGTFTPMRISNLVNGNTTGLNPSYTTGGYWDYGFGGGVTVPAFHLGPVSVSADLRASTRPGSPGADTILSGVKLGFKLPLVSLKPYIQASGGYVRTRTPLTSSTLAGQTTTFGFAAYQIFGGVDSALVPHLDLRLIEIGGGRGTEVTGPNSNVPDITLLTLSTGVVLHF